MTYFTLTRPCTARLDIKKSEFIAHAYPVADREQAMFHVKQLKQTYSDARHHCWAYVIGDPNNTTSAGFDDDGEPNGTAGRPILNVLQHKTIGNVIIIVVRYFGGIKLGAGGLTRAYAGSAQAVVDMMQLTAYVAKVDVCIHTDFANESYVRYLVEDSGGKVLTVNYGKSVVLKAQVSKQAKKTLAERLGAVGKLVERDLMEKQ